MRAPSRTRNRHLAPYTQVVGVLLLAVAIGAGIGEAQTPPPTPIPSTSPSALTPQDIATSQALGYTVPGDTVMVGDAATLTFEDGRPLPAGIRDYKDTSQCVHLVAHYIYDHYNNTAFFFPGRKDPRNGRDFPRHHAALGGKSGRIPTVHAVLVTTEGRTGHVAVVTAVADDGQTFTVLEQNYAGRGIRSERTFLVDDPRIRTFLYIDEVAPPAPPTPEPAVAASVPVQDEYTLPASAIAAPGETPTHFTGRFQQVPTDLAPIYEEAARTYGFPVRYLAADGSYETHFTSKLGDGGRSCGIHQWNANSSRVQWPQNWGFASVEDCLDPYQNIMKLGEAWSKWRDTRCNGSIRCAIQLHNSGSATYAKNVMAGAEAYYSH